MFIDICYRISANSGVKRLTKDVKRSGWTTNTTPATPETLHVLPGLPRDGAYSLPSYSESLLSADDVPQVEAVDTVDAVAHLMASKTLSDKDNIVMREREKLNVLKDLLEVQKKRLQIEEQKFAYITSLHQTGQSELNVSPIIQFL
ncbi:uncharacterized protein LOC124271749 isoform X2 [Haliotis rubra]|uniref:uncharacterized protein LOC124271749 isoform X2 n=1 Tax=Haliotis rubra TaxID=36100 RepID=UPI001EE5E17C|nr:uncharacterized protein LOC124271749 isoform X2 [Haliotis rubra]